MESFEKISHYTEPVVTVAIEAKHMTTLEDWSIKKLGEGRACPECHMPLDFGEGCNMGICKHCGWSGCS